MGDLRLFVAIYPPEDTARAMLRAMRKLDPPAHRPTRLDQVHLTLQFIGDTPSRDLDAVSESVERSGAGIAPFMLTPWRLLSLPPRGRPRLIACETDAPAPLLELQRRLVTRLARKPRPNPGDRFVPHLTLCRFTRSARPHDVDHPVAIEPFPIDRVLLVRSILRPEGAEHAPVHEVSLA